MAGVELVGILNMTPDSFSDGDRFVHAEAGGSEIIEVAKAVLAAEDMFVQGANLIDVGGESTRPGAGLLTSDGESARVVGVMSALLRAHPGKIALDSYHPETHRRVAGRSDGDFIINDVTGFNNPEMVSVAAELGMRCIISHLPARWGNDIQAAHRAEPLMDSVDEVARELLMRRGDLVAAGVPKDKIILDPGMGFGKTVELNAKLLRFTEYMHSLDPDAKVMVGYSRKRFLGDKRMDLEPNLQAARIAIASGANYLRVHDVAGHLMLINGLPVDQ